MWAKQMCLLSYFSSESYEFTSNALVCQYISGKAYKKGSSKYNHTHTHKSAQKKT